MPLPLMDTVPSESTIAEVTNRRLLERLGDPRAWVLSPSNVKEADLGYDAAFQHVKIAVIQYKKGVVGATGRVSASVTVPQHRALREAYDSPGWVFYAFGLFGSYRDLDEAHQMGMVLNRMLFVDAHDFTVGTSTLSFRDSRTLHSVEHSASTGTVPYVLGEEWVRGVADCRYGKHLQRCDWEPGDESGRARFGNVRYLLWPQATASSAR